jgi:hypothetical protein
MNELATGADVRRACQELELKMDEVVDQLKQEIRKLKRELIGGLTITMASINMVMFMALNATFNA